MDISFVRHILKSAQDTSVNSPELARSWVNGTTEYHLNPDRANILRPLHLGKNLNVLEIGCSGGILSRYLGEQGHRVTGIKTCQECLDAAKLRCADMANVSFAADAEEIDAALVQHYDLILLVPPMPDLLAPVLKNESGDCAKKELTACLRILRDCLAENGLLIIGAGNRLGLKYWLGATEEHYGKAYIGLWNYGSAAQSPRLFSRNEWLDILHQAELPQHRFLYPFPDHQFADLILSDDFIRTDPNAHSLLYRLRSRDLSAPEWLPDQDEFLYWKSLHQSGYLQDFTNSFLIVAGKERECLKAVFPYDFIRLSKSQQRENYHTVTCKERQQSVVVKKQVGNINTTYQEDAAIIAHAPSSAPYIHGPLLAELWIDALVLGGRTGDFKKLLHQYYLFLVNKLEQSSCPGKYLDLLPFNIILDKEGKYQAFDQEWSIDCDEISAEFILFRALLWFCFAHDIHISCRMAEENLTTLSEFIEFGFQLLSLDYPKLMPGFIELEGQVQHSIDSRQSAYQVRAVLCQPFQQAIRTYQSSLFKTELFWVTETAPLSAENSMSVQARVGQARQTLFFTLPDKIEHLKILRFDPGEQPGFLHLHRLTLRQSTGKAGEGDILWEAVGSDTIAETAILENLHYCPSAIGDVFLSVGQDPQVIIELPEFVTEQSGKGSLLFEAVIDWPQSSDYFAVLDEMRTQRRLMMQMKEEHFFIQRQLEEERRQLEENAAAMRERIIALEHKLDVLRRTWAGRIMKKLKLIPCQF
jgi:SAM-dependent methyltransferase